MASVGLGQDLDLPVPATIIQCLRDTHLVDEQAIRRLIPIIQIRRLAAGDLIVREGALGKAVFILLQGQVAVRSEASEAHIGELGPGTVFGEIGGLLDVPRTMSIRARAPGCTIGVLQREDILQVPALTEALLRLAKERLQADEAREASLLAAFPASLGQLETRFGLLFKGAPVHGGRFVRRADQALLLLTREACAVHVVRGGVQVRHGLAGRPDGRYTAGDQFMLAAGTADHVVQAIGASCIYYRCTDPEPRPAGDAAEAEQEAKDAFGAAAEQASQLHQILRGGFQRRASVAVWSDEGFLRNTPTRGPKRRASQIGLGPAEGAAVADVVDLLERSGVPAGLHRQAILAGSAAGGLLAVNLDPVHQYMDDQLLEAILLVFGPRIGVLSLHDCWGVSDAGLGRLFPQCPFLQRLSLSNCWAVTEAGFCSALADAPTRLAHLEISGCPGLTAAALGVLAGGCGALESLDVSFCKNLGEDAWGQLARWAGSLQSLSVKRCPRLSAGSLLAALGRAEFRYLANLDLSDCSFVSGADLAGLVAQCPALRVLNTAFCQDLPVGFADQLAQANGTRSLRELVLEYCPGFVTDAAVEHIAASWPLLERISLKGCAQLTSQAVRSLGSLAHLAHVDMSSCPLVDPSLLTVMALRRSWTLRNPPSFS